MRTPFVNLKVTFALLFKLLKNVIITVIGMLMIIIGFFAGSAFGNSDLPFYMLALLGMLIMVGNIALSTKK